jgi:quercetin 2,3-dioxygenase
LHEVEKQSALDQSEKFGILFLMQTTLRKSSHRGHANHGWLDTHHSFSFGNYYDPAHMGFRSLRVINEDHVAPGAGFPTHPHHDMEIFSYVVAGAIEHQDSMGNGRRLDPGQIQLMSAGSGVTHSERNPLANERLHLLQIWIKPHTSGLAPAYTEWHPTAESQTAAKVLVISPDGRDSSATIRQDASIYRIRLHSGETVSHTLVEGRGLWLQVIKGSLTAADLQLSAGDGMSTEMSGIITITAQQDAEALLFDLL